MLYLACKNVALGDRWHGVWTVGCEGLLWRALVVALFGLHLCSGTCAEMASVQSRSEYCIYHSITWRSSGHDVVNKTVDLDRKSMVQAPVSRPDLLGSAP